MRTEIRGDEIWPNAKAVSKARDTSFETGEGTVGNSCAGGSHCDPDRDGPGIENKAWILTRRSQEGGGANDKTRFIHNEKVMPNADSTSSSGARRLQSATCRLPGTLYTG
jgi:hypothetical protein